MLVVVKYEKKILKQHRNFKYLEIETSAQEMLIK